MADTSREDANVSVEIPLKIMHTLQIHLQFMWVIKSPRVIPSALNWDLLLAELHTFAFEIAENAIIVLSTNHTVTTSCTSNHC